MESQKFEHDNMSNSTFVISCGWHQMICMQMSYKARIQMKKKTKHNECNSGAETYVQGE